MTNNQTDNAAFSLQRPNDESRERVQLISQRQSGSAELPVTLVKPGGN
jgi:hypothetical protein